MKLDLNKRIPLTDLNASYGIYHLVNRIYIHWDMLTFCNYKCAYCYARRHYEKVNDWGKQNNLELQKHILKCLSFAKLPVFLGLQGGEPTLDKNFIELFLLMQKQILRKDELSRLYITSNLSTNKWDIIIENTDAELKEKIFVLASYHPEHRNSLNFLKNIELVRHHYKTRINIMLLDKPEFVDDIKFVYNELKKMDTKLQIHPQFIYTEGRKSLEKVNFDTYKEMKDSNKEFVYKGKLLSDFEIFENNLNNFYNWKCYYNNFEIDYNGFVKILCKGIKINLKENPLFFKNIKEIEPIICKYKSCNCEGLLKCLKVQE